MKCTVCKKKTLIQCKCMKFTCLSHRFSDQHHCTFDFKQEHKKYIKERLPKLDNNKIVKI